MVTINGNQKTILLNTCSAKNFNKVNLRKLNFQKLSRLKLAHLI